MLEQLDVLCRKGIPEEHIDALVVSLVEIFRRRKKGVDMLKFFIGNEIARTSMKSYLNVFGVKKHF